MAKKPAKKAPKKPAKQTPKKGGGKLILQDIEHDRESEDWQDAEFVFSMLQHCQDDEAIQVLIDFRNGDYDGAAREEMEEDD